MEQVETEPQTCANGCKWLEQDGECTEPSGECNVAYRTIEDEPQTEMPELKNIGEAFKDFCDKTDIGWK